jgi:hypothetical protein
MEVLCAACERGEAPAPPSRRLRCMQQSALRWAQARMALVAPPLRFTAHAINRDGDRVPYTLQFTHGEAHRLSLRIDATVGGVQYEEEVRDVAAVAFLPVALRSPSSVSADEYVMSVWQRDVGVADPQIVHDFQLYSTSLANANAFARSANFFETFDSEI